MRYMYDNKQWLQAKIKNYENHLSKNYYCIIYLTV